MNNSTSGWAFLIIIVLGLVLFGGGVLYENYNDVSNELVITKEVVNQSVDKVAECENTLSQNTLQLNDTRAQLDKALADITVLQGALVKSEEQVQVLSGQVDQLTQANQQRGAKPGLVIPSTGSNNSASLTASALQPAQLTEALNTLSGSIPQGLIVLTLIWVLVVAWIIIFGIWAWHKLSTIQAK